MAIAQVWSNRPRAPSLPQSREVERRYDDHLSWVNSTRSLRPDRGFVKMGVRSDIWLPWMMYMAACDVDEYLGFLSLESWKL